MAGDPLGRLQELLERCQVEVRGESLGSGFFVAPGYLLTCSHVAGTDAGARVKVVWRERRKQERTLEGTVRAASPAPAVRGDMWPFPDLAVVEISGRCPDHPCVWLSDVVPAFHTPLVAAGLSAVYEPLNPRRFLASLSSRGVQELSSAQGRMLVLDGEITKGMSGGPILSAESGRVCGVVKAARLQDSDMGGLATPMRGLRALDPDVYRRVIRAHDRFHASDSAWSKIADRVAGAGEGADGLTGAEERRLLAAIGELPEAAGSHEAAFLSIASVGTQLPDWELLDRRDVFTELAARDGEADDLPDALAYAVDLARQGVSRAHDRLSDRVVRAARRLGVGDAVRQRLEQAPIRAEQSSIIARLRPSLLDRRRYHVMMWRYEGTDRVVAAGGESEALPLEEAVAVLAERLPEQISVMGGVSKPGLIEFLVPREVMDEDFSNWRLWPRWSWFLLGHKQHVVLRALERHEEPELHAAWVDRWERLGAGAVGDVLSCVCGRDGQNESLLGACFDSDPGLGALALPGSPVAPQLAMVYDVAVASGVPVMLWQRGSQVCARSSNAECGVPGPGTCLTNQFLAHARQALATTTVDQLPERVRELRNEAVKLQQRHHVGDRLVILWDDPGRRIPSAPLVPTDEGVTA
ncbi:trypsin-like peptidase domain-containing protein [Streptomyces sp. Tu102]|uniref:VMAP-C domain-containing protein n=1 Tax=Streptomyces TaxID=1883 RepID=UPI001BDBFA04|nr:trypsin-like peptidase domain-containing protein [Streptomyces sp. Tu102]MBT1094204.1 trypsin-like peptidase domain-containing protein [Streptomyces sp. Tu102]